MVKVCELNYETWRFIRAETDDDFEWLPNPKQKGVLGLPVRDVMIDGWLKMVKELEDALTGKKVIDLNGLGMSEGQGLNVKELLDHPPEQIVVMKLWQKGIGAKYLTKLTADNVCGTATLFTVQTLFDNALSGAYFAWFN